MTVQEQITQTASAYGVPTSIALAVANKESGFNQGARGTSGEVGIFQLMPTTAAGLNVNPYDQTQNINGGISLLSQLYAKFHDWTKALAAYNGGNNPPAVSYTYARSVLDSAQIYGITQEGVSLPLDTGDYSTGDYSVASVMPDLPAIPNWAWLVALGAVAVAMLVRRS